MNFLSPTVTAEGVYYAPGSGSFNHSQRNERIGIQFPIKNKLSLGVSLKELLESNSILEAAGKMQPKAYQIMGNVDGYHSLVDNSWTTDNQPQDLVGARIGFTGLHAWFKNRKVGSLIWNVNVAVMENTSNFTSFRPNLTGFIGTGGLHRFKTIWCVGIFTNYYSGLFVTPFIYANKRLGGAWKLEVIAPKEIKVNYKQSKKWKQSLVFGLDGNQFGSPIQPLADSALVVDGINQVGLLKASTQTRLRFGKKVLCFLEGGYYLGGGYRFSGGEIYREQISAGWMARLKLNISIGKALISRSKLGLDF